jgi:hypothetical protein
MVFYLCSNFGARFRYYDSCVVHATSLKQNELQPRRSKYWKTSTEGSAPFVAQMEDVPEVYHLPYDPDYPMVYIN